jgi:hypothetical protein
MHFSIRRLISIFNFMIIRGKEKESTGEGERNG